jgi:hypothetical protein
MTNRRKINNKYSSAVAAAAAAAAVVAVDIKYIKEELAEIKVKLDRKYVTQTEFKPVKSIVYGAVGVILVTVIGALITLVITSSK